MTVAESKERKVKRMTSEVIRRMNRLDQRAVPLIHEIAEMKQNMSWIEDDCDKRMTLASFHFLQWIFISPVSSCGMELCCLLPVEGVWHLFCCLSADSKSWVTLWNSTFVKWINFWVCTAKPIFLEIGKFWGSHHETRFPQTERILRFTPQNSIFVEQQDVWVHAVKSGGTDWVCAACPMLFIFGNIDHPCTV